MYVYADIHVRHAHSCGHLYVSVCCCLTAPSHGPGQPPASETSTTAVLATSWSAKSVKVRHNVTRNVATVCGQ